MTVQLKKIAKQYENDYDGLNIYLDDQVDSLDHRLQFILPCKDKVLRPNSTFFFSKGDLFNRLVNLFNLLN